MKYFKESQREQLKQRFFNTARGKWLNIESDHNHNKIDICLFYSLDEDSKYKPGYRKRDLRNPVPKGWAWLPIEHNFYQFKFLRDSLLITQENKHDISYKQGRKIDGVFVKDALFDALMNWVNDTFDPWFNKHVEKEQPPTSATEPYKTTKLF